LRFKNLSFENHLLAALFKNPPIGVKAKDKLEKAEDTISLFIISLMSTSVVKHGITNNEIQPRQKRFKVGRACFTCREKKIKVRFNVLL
jgi:hypothetical protein